MEYFHIFLESLSSFLKYHCLYCSNIKVSLISWILRECHTEPLQFPQHDSVRDKTWFKTHSNKCLVAEFSPLCSYNSEILNSSKCWAPR